MTNLVQTKNRMTFTDVWDEASKMLNDFKASPFYDTTNFNIGDSSVTMTYFLLYNRYGNTEIINNDLNQFKYKLFGVIMQYGPTWEQKVKIQAKIRSLGLEDTSDIYKGSKAIYNHAFNPETTPTTGDLEEINYINDQNTTMYKKSKLEGLAILVESLKDDITSMYIDKFRKLFKQVVVVTPHVVYVEEEDEDES